MKKSFRLFVLVLFIVFGISVTFNSIKVVALGGANEGTSPAGGGCSDGRSPWWDECFGYSWQAYKVEKDLPSGNEVTFHYTGNTGGPVYLHYCKAGQTLYNYGFEVYNGYSTSLGTQVSTQTDKDGEQASWRSGGALGAYAGSENTTSGYLTADGYASADVVEKKFEKMLAYDKEHGTNYAHGTTWDTVGYFCWDEGASSVDTTFSATTQATKVGGSDATSYRYKHVDDSSKPTKEYVTSGSSVKVEFSNVLKRTDDKNINSNSRAKVDVSVKKLSYGQNSSSWDHSAGKPYEMHYSTYLSGATAYTIAKGGSKTINDEYTVSGLVPGDLVEVCERILYDSKVTMSSSAAAPKEHSASDWSCVAIHAKGNTTFSGETSATKIVDNGSEVNASGYSWTYNGSTKTSASSSERYATRNGTISVKFDNSVKRTDAYNISSPTRVKVDISVRKYSYNDNTSSFGKGTWSGGTWNHSKGKASDLSYADYLSGVTAFSVAKDGKKTLSSTYTISGLKAGDMVDVCERVIYDSVVAVWHSEKSPTSQGASSWKCVTVNVEKEFEGYSEVKSGSKSKSTGWKSSGSSADNTAMLSLKNCNSGCEVSFKHELQQNGIGTASGVSYYEIYTAVKTFGNSSSVVKKGRVGSTAMTYSGTKATIKTGEIVCQRMRFVNIIGFDVKNTASTRACAYAEGTIGSSIDIKAKDENGSSKYSTWRDDYVYAKPLDYIDFRGVYTPSYQYTYNLYPKKTQIKTGSSIIKSANNSGRKLGVTFNSMVSPNWNNGFSVGLNNNYKSYDNREYKRSAGVSTRDSRTLNRSNSGAYQINKYDVGRTVKATASTNTSNNIQITPKNVEFVWEDGGFTATVNKDSETDSVDILVPYNFRTRASVRTGSETVFYAGGTGSVEFNVSVLKKKNSETTDGSDSQKYATLMKDAKIRAVFYYADHKDEKDGVGSWGNESVDLCTYFGMTKGGGDCDYSNVGGEKRDLEPKSDESPVDLPSANVNIKDVKAGSNLCVAVAVYPSSSGADTNLNKNGNGRWRISKSKCFLIAKKPSFQVWGGSVYSAGKINVPWAEKNNLADTTSPTGYRTGTYIFGSWTELSLVANGSVTGLASGAGLGYAQNNNGTLWPNYTFTGAGGKTANYKGNGNNGSISGAPGGSTDNNYCKMSTLSFANSACNTTSGVGNLGGSSVGSSVESDKSALVSNFNDATSSEYELTQQDSGDYDIGAMEIPQGITKVIKVSNGTAKIKGDVKYAAGPYNTLEQIPKLIIYAKNIEIACSVERIDAVLIADGDIDTCNSGDKNNEQNSTQLKINGSIITNKLKLNRTYGAATGANSIIPAEIVNYDASLYLWANKQSTVTTSGKLTEASVKELAPRY